MSQTAPSSTRSDPIGRGLTRVSRLFVIIGGIALTAAGFLTVASVVGRYFFNAPIPGDFELVEIGCAIAVFAFLPYCQMTRGNVVVDFFTAGVSTRRRAALDLAANALFTLIAGLLTWRAVLGGLDLQRYQETTMVLAVPLWWGFVPAVFCLAVLTLVSAYTVLRSRREAATGRPLDAESGQP